MIDLYTYDWLTANDILSKNYCQPKFVSILTHRMIKNKNNSFKDSAILNKTLEFPVNLIWTETHIYALHMDDNS